MSAFLYHKPQWWFSETLIIEFISREAVIMAMQYQRRFLEEKDGSRNKKIKDALLKIPRLFLFSHWIHLRCVCIYETFTWLFLRFILRAPTMKRPDVLLSWLNLEELFQDAWGTSEYGLMLLCSGLERIPSYLFWGLGAINNQPLGSDGDVFGECPLNVCAVHLRVCLCVRVCYNGYFIMVSTLQG